MSKNMWLIRRDVTLNAYSKSTMQFFLLLKTRNRVLIETVYEIIDKRAITPVKCHIAGFLQFISCVKQGRSGSQ